MRERYSADDLEWLGTSGIQELQEALVQRAAEAIYKATRVPRWKWPGCVETAARLSAESAVDVVLFEDRMWPPIEPLHVDAAVNEIEHAIMSELERAAPGLLGKPWLARRRPPLPSAPSRGMIVPHGTADG
jgi:hypothetical protein